MAAEVNRIGFLKCHPSSNYSTYYFQYILIFNQQKQQFGLGKVYFKIENSILPKYKAYYFYYFYYFLLGHNGFYSESNYFYIIMTKPLEHLNVA